MQTGQCSRCLFQKHTCTGSIIIPVQCKTCLCQRTRDAARMIKVSLALRKLLILPRLQLRRFDFFLMKGQHINPLQPLLLAGFQLRNLPPQRKQRLILGAILCQKRFTACITIQIVDMMLFIQQFLSVVLPMNIDQIRGKLPQHRCGNRLHIHPAGTFTVRRDLPLDMQGIRFFSGQRQFIQQRLQRRRQRGKHRADKAFLCP